MNRKRGSLALLFSLLIAAPAVADDWNYTPLGGVATELTGGYGAVGNPTTGFVYNGTDPLFGDSSSSYAVIIDSGSSGFLMSQTVTDVFNVPLQGTTYTETGLGGSEIENVTQPLTAYFGPPSLPDPDNTATMTAYGTYTFESRQNDPFEFFQYFDIIGTPMIQNRVMVVTPSQSYDLVQETLGFLTAQTVVQATAPVLPAKGTYHVPITWTNFVNATTVPTEGLNPVITGATVRGSTNTDIATNFLVDTGAQFSIISHELATSLGVDLDNPITTVAGLGVGGAQVTFDEFQISQIALPLSDGNRLVFHNVFVWVPEAFDLPTGLSAILGENILMQGADGIDPDSGQLVFGPDGLPYASLFTQWYLDGPGSQLVLYDPNSAYIASVPEPASVGLLALGSILFLLRRRRK